MRLLLLLLLVTIFVYLLINSRSTYDGDNIIFVLRSHVCNDYTQRLWNKLSLECGNVYMIYDNTKGTYKDNFYSGNVILHTEEDCKEINKLHDKIYTTVESSLCFLKKKENLEFDYMWVIENLISNYLLREYKEILDQRPWKS